MSEPVQDAVRAVSRDGRTFSFDHDGEVRVLPGDLVVLTPDGSEPLLGQVLEQAAAVAPDAEITCTGLLIGTLGEGGVRKRFPRRPFRSAGVERAEVAHIEALQSSSGADLPIGTWTSCGVDVTARLRAQGFGRHSFLCGQSGSGKTYALGVLLEQIMLGTDLRMVVLDPNADFVRLGQARPDAPAEEAERLAGVDVRVLGATGTGLTPLRMRYMTMPVAARAAVLQLDPLVDRGEYNFFLHMNDDSGLKTLDELLARIHSGGADGSALEQRLENLGLISWEVWAQEERSAYEVLQDGARVAVMNLSGFHDPREPLAVSLDLIEGLWANRESRTPTLIVIDEAHNICPAQPSGALQEALVERLIQIAAEGRKYGLWLFLSTQRPSKIHPQVLSQCDNLALMRMNSPGDIAELAEVFGFAPPEMLGSSRYFMQGEALIAGGFTPAPAIIRMGARLTHEGGSDVPVPVG